MNSDNNTNQGTLYLIPAALGEGSDYVIPEYVKKTAGSIRHFIVENEKTARRFLIKMGMKLILPKISFYELNKKISFKEWANYLQPVYEGEDIGLLSEAGCPAVADPGAEMVQLAHEKNIRVIPLVGPSSILLALMASGLNGQNFTFWGYLPKKQHERIKKLKMLEQQSKQYRQTQIFMETPYRNRHVLEDIIGNCKDDTSLCIASNLTLHDEFIKTKTIKEWKKRLPNMHKKLVIFLIDACPENIQGRSHKC